MPWGMHPSNDIDEGGHDGRAERSERLERSVDFRSKINAFD
jgi:hypothetical protein